MPKCDFNKVASNFIKIALRHGCSPLNLLHIFRTPFTKNTFERLLLQYLQWCFFDNSQWLAVVNHCQKEFHLRCGFISVFAFTDGLTSSFSPIFPLRYISIPLEDIRKTVHFSVISRRNRNVTPRKNGLKRGYAEECL